MMEVTSQQLAGGVERVALAGRMDSAGAEQIDLRFTALMTTRPALIVVDMSQVSFLASMGIRLLLSAAQALERRGGRMVLASPQPAVDHVLRMTAVDQVVPIHPDVASACEALTSPARSA